MKIRNAAKTYLLITVGTMLLCISTTYFILPANVYNGGVLGTSQVIQSVLKDVLHIEISADFEIAGILNLFFNIPLFILAYKNLPKIF